MSRSFATRIFLALLRVYRRRVSLLLGANCRFVPSCSAYTEQALAQHGFWAGLGLAAWRLARCHPLGGRGLDPVPDSPTLSRGR
jgi:putative membrane protein insertion efficiency factor